MVRWRNIFFALFVSAWAHGLAAAVLHTVGLGCIATFCTVVAILSVLGLIPVGCEVSEQAEEEVRRLRAQLAERELREPLP